MYFFFQSPTEQLRMDERAEAPTRREKVGEALLTPAEMQKIMTSQFMMNTLRGAAAALVNPEVRPRSVQEAIVLRNCLITRLMLGSLRRTMEFIEFRLGEFRARTQRIEDGSTNTVIRVARHKTGFKGMFKD